MPSRVAIGEDSLIVREGVRQLLAVDPEVEIVAAVADELSLRQACEDEHPDVVLTDIRMPPTHTDEGIRLAAELRETHPEIGVVILSQFSDPAYALALLEQGSDGRAYLLKERVHNRAELMAAIRAVAAGGSMIDPKVVEALVVARGRAERSPLNDLTAREREVLAEIAQGKSNTAIADSLFLTKRAVEKHINAIFWKLGLADAADVSKRVQAALMFLSEDAASPSRVGHAHQVADAIDFAGVRDQSSRTGCALSAPPGMGANDSCASASRVMRAPHRGFKDACSGR